MIRLRENDCKDVLRLIPENHIDLTVTSPPYDNLRTYNNSLEWSESVWRHIIKELYRITKKGGVVVWVVGDATVKGSETGTSFKQALYFKEVGFNLHDTMIWLKDSISFPDKIRYQNSFEYMFIFSKGMPKTKNLIEDRENKSFGRKVTGTGRNRDGTTRVAACRGNKIKKFSIRWNTWRIATNKGNVGFNHPAMFPLQIAKDHIVSWSNEGDIVLDPFMGSGTTGIAAKTLNRKFFGIEKEREYFKIARKRIFGEDTSDIMDKL